MKFGRKFENVTIIDTVFLVPNLMQEHPDSFTQNGLNPSLKYEVKTHLTWNYSPVGGSGVFQMHINGTPMERFARVFPAYAGNLEHTTMCDIVDPNQSGEIELKLFAAKSLSTGTPIRIFSVIYTIQELQP